MKGLVISQFWKDEHGLIGRKKMMYCYAFVPKYPERVELEALKLSEQELAKMKEQAIRKGFADSTRQRMDQLLQQLKSELDEKTSSVQEP